MVRSFYTSTSGLKAQEQRMNNVANNLANVNRTGFKRDISVMKAFPEMLISRLMIKYNACRSVVLTTGPLLECWELALNPTKLSLIFRKAASLKQSTHMTWA